MIHIKTGEEIELMRESALVVSKTLGMLASEIKPGADPLQLDKMAEEFIREQGAEPGFLGMYDFPNTLNWSPNAQVVHGIPNNEPLKEGDIISVDCGALKNGFYGDHAYTFEVGEVAPETKKLLQVTKESLYVGIREFKLGNRVGDVAFAIQNYCESHGYGVVRELVGHGLGKDLHEDPQMPNYGKRGTWQKVRKWNGSGHRTYDQYGYSTNQTIKGWLDHSYRRWKAQRTFRTRCSISGWKARVIVYFSIYLRGLGDIL